MSIPQYNATITGQISWVLLFDFDNTNNSGELRETRTISTSESIEYTNFEQTFNSTVRKELEDNKVGTEVGASYEGISAKVNASIEVSTEVTDTLQQTTSSTFKSTYSKTTSYTHYFVIGAHSKLAIYQQRFTAPGIDVLGDALVTKPPPPQDVPIQYLVQPIRFIKGLNVVYGGSPSDAPGDRVREYNGGNDDINAGYGGKYVWIVPVYTFDAAEAATLFVLFIQDNGHDGWSDLAAGAGGSYRFLIPYAEASNPVKITDLRLYRSDNGVTTFPAPFTGHTSDINANRKGSYLYLMWSTRRAF